MAKTKDLIKQFKDKGYRLSAARNFMLELMEKNDNPLSVFEFQKMLKKNNLSVNKTTIYREINLLKKEGIILEIQLKENNKRYELSSKKHHHHIVCIKCKKITDFINNDSEKIINKVLKSAPDFAKITSHSFELFGLCKSCNKKYE